MKRFLFMTLCLVVTCISCSSDEGDSFAPDTISSLETDFYTDGEIEVLFENAPDNGATMVFIGDGYIKEDLGKQFGTYRKDAIRYFDALFSIEPYASYKEHFNAVIVYAESEKRDINDLGEENTTALGTVAYTSDNGRTFFDAEDDRGVPYYTSVTSQYTNVNFLIVVQNFSEGIATANSNFAYSGSQSTLTMVHEVAHSFGGLQDEYGSQDSNDFPIDVSTAANLDSTGNVDVIKWNHFIGRPGYENVGAYEGGAYLVSGVWRPSFESIMRGGNSPEAKVFNAPSREAIVKKILNIRGIPYDFETFLEKDVAALRASTTEAFSEHDYVQCGLIVR